MKIRLISVGKPRDPELAALHQRYAERIVRFGVHYDTVWAPETRAGGRFTEEHVKEREAQALLDRAGDSRGQLIALDATGRLFDSETLAERIESWATPGATLFIGGPLGLHPSLLEKVQLCWSLSPLTFPHELMRVLVAEQLYRALTILRGMPYHK